MTRPHANGYSLAELLVVLALLGMISVAISSGMRFGARVWEKSGQQVTAMDTVVGAQSLLRTVLQRVIPRDLDPGIPADPALFRGAQDRMSFTANSAAAVDANGIARFELSTIDRAGQKSLLLKWTPVSGPKTVQSQEIVSNASSISFSYAVLDQTGVFVWRRDWEGQSGVPALISVSVRYPGSSTLVWPEFLVRPRVAREPTCIYDPVSFGCRHG